MNIRIGRLTSSRADAMLAAGRGNAESVQRRNLRVQLALERLGGRSLERDYQSNEMRIGTEREAAGLALYEAVSGELISRVGFVAHDTVLAGCSPDGVVGDFVGLCECKAPIPATHLDTLRTEKVPTDYLRQIWHQLWITGAAWCDWISFNPDFPESMQLKVIRVPRDPLAIQTYEEKALAFLQEVDREVQTIRTLSDLPGTLRAAVSA